MWLKSGLVTAKALQPVETSSKITTAMVAGFIDMVAAMVVAVNGEGRRRRKEEGWWALCYEDEVNL